MHMDSGVQPIMVCINVLDWMTEKLLQQLQNEH